MEQYYFRCGKNNLETRNVVEEEIIRWITSPELTKIVEAFGGNIPSGITHIELARWLLDFSGIIAGGSKRQRTQRPGRRPDG